MQGTDPPQGERGPKILIVDDDPVIVRLLQINFRLEGYEVDTASRGDQAVERARAGRPDLVILDVMMPGLDGWEVCRQLKELPEIRDVPVIFLSARAQDEDRRRGYALGVDEYVTKPFDPGHLVEIVRRTLARSAEG
ncbi:MAG: response regulator transcription factor [Candidatus Velamenicoccus archaeovorus]